MLRLSTYPYRFRTYTRTFCHKMVRFHYLLRNAIFERTMNYSLGVFFKKWCFHIDNKNPLYFARIYVYMTCNRIAKMRAIARLVFLKNTVKQSHTQVKISLQTSHTSIVILTKLNVLRLSTYPYRFRTYTRTFCHKMVRFHYLLRNAIFERTMNYSLGVFFKKWCFHIDNKNPLYFARIYVYMTCNRIAKMRAIARLVFLKITVKQSHTQ